VTAAKALGIIVGLGLGSLIWAFIVAAVVAIRGHDDRPYLDPEYRRLLDDGTVLARDEWPEGVELPRYTGADARRELEERWREQFTTDFDDDYVVRLHEKDDDE